MCPNLSHLQLSSMDELTEAGRLSMVSLLRQIVQSNPPIQVLNMNAISQSNDKDVNMGELILEALLNSNIQSITDLNFSYNRSWFKRYDTQEDRAGIVELLAEIIYRQSSLQHLNLFLNYFSSNAT